MKVLFLASCALAASLTARQTPEINADTSLLQGVINTVISQTTDLRGGINSFDGSEGSIASLNSTANTLVDYLLGGPNTIASIGDGAIDLTQAANFLLVPFTELNYLVGNATADAVSNKQDFVDASVGGLVLSQLQRIREAAAALLTDAITKLGESVDTVANPIANSILAALDNAIAQFQDQAGQPPPTTTGDAPTSTPSETATETATETDTETTPTSTGDTTETTPSPTGGDGTPTTTATSTGASGPTTSLPAPTSSSTSLPPYDDNAAAPTAVAAFGVAGMALLAAVAVI